MNDDVSWKLLGKFLFSECTEEEKTRIHEWIEEDPSRKTLLEHLRHLLRMTKDSPNSQEWDTEVLWERIDEQTRREDAQREVGEYKERTHSRRSPSSSRAGRKEARLSELRKRVWTGIVTVVVGVVISLWLFGPLKTGLQTSSSSGPKTFETEKGQRATVRLTDGTQIRLNVDSRLTVPQSFGADSRDVQLEGEAFFEVASGSARPFRVHAGGAVTRVLGTEFDVSAYPEERETRVVVAEGRVSMRSNQSTGGKVKEIVVGRQQMGQILSSGEQVVRRDLNVSSHLAWMEGQLALEDAPFTTVVRKLERWYGLDITLPEDHPPPDGHLNARFTEDQPIPEVLGLVSTAFGVEYTRDEKRVTFVFEE